MKGVSMRVPVQIKMNDSHEVAVIVDGVDLGPAVVQAGLQVDPDRGSLLILHLAVDAEVDLPAVAVENRSPILVNDFLADVSLDNLRKIVDQGDFATHPADHVMAALRSRAGS